MKTTVVRSSKEMYFTGHGEEPGFEVTSNDPRLLDVITAFYQNKVVSKVNNYDFDVEDEVRIIKSCLMAYDVLDREGGANGE